MYEVAVIILNMYVYYPRTQESRLKCFLGFSVCVHARACVCVRVCACVYMCVCARARVCPYSAVPALPH